MPIWKPTISHKYHKFVGEFPFIFFHATWPSHTRDRCLQLAMEGEYDWQGMSSEERRNGLTTELTASILTSVFLISRASLNGTCRD